MSHVRAIMMVLGAAACSGNAPLKAPQTPAPPQPDPIEALRPRAHFVPYAIDQSSIDEISLRGHYPFTGHNVASDDAAALAAVRDALSSDFAVLSAHVNVYGLTLDVTALRKDQELAPDGADASKLQRFVALTDQISPWCGRGGVRWLPPTIEREHGHESNTKIERRGFSGATDGYALVTVSALRNSDVESGKKPWSVWCGSGPGHALRPALREIIHGPALLAHPDLRVTDRATHSLGRYITPQESCAGAHVKGLTCDPISASMWMRSADLPATEDIRPLTPDDTREQVRVTPVIQLACDGTVRFVVLFALAGESRIERKPHGAELEQTIHHLEMKPVVLDLVTGEHLPSDLPTAITWDIDSGQPIVTSLPRCPTLSTTSVNRLTP